MLVIVDYEAGNLTSVRCALQHLGANPLVSRNPDEVAQADKIIFPGVGAAGSAMTSLTRLGLDQALKNAFRQNIPILGICLGSQIILNQSEENQTTCLGLLPGTVRRLELEKCRSKEGWPLKVPHMGWNKINWRKKHPIFAGLEPNHEFYFVHSYYLEPASGHVTLGETSYGQTFTSVIAYKNLVATQFHPEKSGRPGLKILKNFLEWNGSIS